MILIGSSFLWSSSYNQPIKLFKNSVFSLIRGIYKILTSFSFNSLTECVNVVQKMGDKLEYSVADFSSNKLLNLFSNLAFLLLVKLKISLSKSIIGCSGKIVFFHNSLQPLPRLHRCKRPSQLSTQCECKVVQPIAAKFWRWRGRKLSRILG